MILQLADLGTTTHILDESVVMQVRIKGSRLSVENSKESAMASRRAMATLQAISYPSATRSGWMPMSSSFSACTQEGAISP
jgi:hypothetical protein